MELELSNEHIIDLLKGLGVERVDVTAEEGEDGVTFRYAAVPNVPVALPKKVKEHLENDLNNVAADAWYSRAYQTASITYPR